MSRKPEPPDNVLPILLEMHLSEIKEKQVDIAARMKPEPWTRQRWNRHLNKSKRVPGIPTLVKFRKGIRWSRARFWKAVIKHYDP